MAGKRFDVIGLGITVVDVLVRMPPQVVHGAKQFVEELAIQGGAPTGSGICAIGQLGYQAATVSRMGNDTLSGIARDQFQRYGVSLELCVTDESVRPAVALVQIDPADAARTVFINLDHYGYLREQDIPTEAIRNARVLLVDSYDLDATEAALEAARGSDCRCVVDFEGGDADRLRKLIGLADDAVLPLECAARLSGEDEPTAAIGKLRGMAAGPVVVTDGTAGSWGCEADGTIVHQPAFAVAARDTTGCGDAYHAGYVVGLLEGWPLGLRMEFGAWLASRVATAVGGRTALPRRGEVLDHGRDELSDDLRIAVEACKL